MIALTTAFNPKKSDLPESLQRALQGSPLRTPEGGRRFVKWMLVLLLITFLGQAAIFTSMSVSATQVYFAGMALALVSSVPTLALIRYLDRRERESSWLLAGSLIWGAVIGTGLAAVLNAFGLGLIVLTETLGSMTIQDLDTTNEILTAVTVAPPIEELTKGLGVLLIFWFLRAEFDNLRDGIIYGGLIGLGFLIAEYSIYLVDALQEGGSPPYLELLALRNVFFGANYHAIWTALFGAGIGLARQTQSRWVSLAAPLIFYLLAVFCHALNNSLGIVLISALLGAFGIDIEQNMSLDMLPAIWTSAAIMNIVVQFWAYALLALLLIKSGRDEIRVIRRYLANEIGRAVTPEEYVQIENEKLFMSRRIPGYAGDREMAIVNAQNELAFRKWHLANEGIDIESDPLVGAWREDIAKLRGLDANMPNTVSDFGSKTSPV